MHPTRQNDRPQPREGLTVRRIEVDDAAAYVDLLAQIDSESDFLAWEPGERSVDPVELVSRIEGHASTRSLHLLALADDVPVGVLVCHRPPVRRLRHRADFTIAVRAAYQSRGLGSRLIAAMEAWAAGSGVERLELTVMAHNDRAIRLYRHLGFVDEGRKRGSIRVDGRPVDELMMAKRVAPSSAVRSTSGA